MRSSNCYQNINEVNALNREHKIDVGRITHWGNKDRNRQNRSSWYTVHLYKPDMKWSPQTLWNGLGSAPRSSLRILESHVARRSMLKALFLAFDLVIIAGLRKKLLSFSLLERFEQPNTAQKFTISRKKPRINSLQFKKCGTCLQLLVYQFARSRVVTSYLKWVNSYLHRLWRSFIRCFVTWRHLEKSSVRLFNKLCFPLFIGSFSLRLKLHCLDPVLYAAICLTIDQLMLNLRLFSFSFQIPLDSSVLFAYL